MSDEDAETDQASDGENDDAADVAVPGVAAGQVSSAGGALNFADLPEPDFAGLYAADELQADGDNPNEMSDKTFGLLVDRMRKNGWLGGPIIANTEGIIADGEHRWKAAKEIGLTEVPVRLYDIDEGTRRLWRQELNKIHGEHDSRRDALEYDFLIEQGRRDEVLELTDARGEDLDELLRSLQVERSRPVAVDYGDDPNVHYMDCVEGMRQHLDDDSVDFVFTSPPYNVALAAGDDPKTEKYEAYDDEMDPDEYREFIGDVLDELARVIKPTGHIFFNIHVDTRGGTISTHEWICDRIDVPWRSYCVWNKRNSSRATINMQDNGRFLQSWEPVYHFSQNPGPLPGRRNFAVWDIDQSMYEYDHDTEHHPAPFPVALVKHPMEVTTAEGDMVLDPFLGSGTTAVAAIEMERDYVGFELDAKGAYKPIIERRVKDAHRRMAAAATPEEAAAMREEAEATGDD